MNDKLSDKISQTKEYVFARDKFKCQYEGCDVRGQDNLQMAHKINRGNSSRNFVMQHWFAEYGIILTFKEAEAILNHPMNLISSCAEHNSYWNIRGDEMETIDLLEQIKEKTDNEAK